MNRNYSTNKKGCPLLNTSLFTLNLFFVLKDIVVPKSKSKALRREQSLSYTE